MTTESNAPTSLAQLQQRPAQMPVTMGFFDAAGFELIQRIAKAFASSDLVPKQYQQNLPNCMIALDMAQRISASPLMVMQNLYIVHGNPGWSSKFLIATINVCGRFNALRYEWKGTPGNADYGCRAWTIEKSTGERLDGVWVTWSMVKAEGWDGKSGSKWKTMADQMFVYRAASFWQRAYAPELGMGLPTAEELHDFIDATPDGRGAFAVDLDTLRQPDAAPDARGETVDTETGEVLTAAAEPAAASESTTTRRTRSSGAASME